MPGRASLRVVGRSFVGYYAAMTVEHEETVRVDVPPDKVWAVYADVERWPEWTPVMQKIERLEDGPLALGSTARIEAKGGPPSVWTVTELTDGRSFTWEARARGVRLVAWHAIEADGDGSKVKLGVRMTGLMATLLGPFLRSVAKRNVSAEAEGLKRRCEGAG
jgi:carbon monoxide dehydrogenase subunit G